MQRGTEWEPIAEMQGDGVIYRLHGDRREFVGHITGDAMQDAHDTPMLTCVHREVGLPGSNVHGHYEADDTYVDDRTRISIADDGTVTFALDGKASSDRHVRVEGPIPKVKRTAVMFVLMASAPR